MPFDLNSAFSEQYLKHKQRKLSLQWDSSATVSDLAGKCAAIPDYYDILSFSASNLSKLTDKDLQIILEKIPAHVKTVLLRHIFMTASNKMTIALAALSAETISFAENDFSFSTAAYLWTIFAAVRAKHLQLSATSLHKLGAHGIGLVLDGISSLVKILDLDSNALGSLGAVGFSLVMGKIPQGVLVLNLCDTKLESLSDAELAAGLAQLKAPLTALNLSANDLSQHGFKLTLGSLPPTLSSLDLSNTGLDYLSVKSLIAHFQAINPKIMGLHLNLSGNSLGQTLGLEDLATVLAAFPPGISSIDLSNNDLEHLTMEEWISLIAKLPLSVTELRCNGPSQQKINRIFHDLRQEAFNITMEKTPLSTDLVNTVMAYALSNPNGFFSVSQAMEIKQDILKDLVLR